MTRAPGGARARSVGALLRETATELGSAAEARWVLSHAAGEAGRGLLAHPGEEVPAGVASEVAAIVDRVHAGEPLQYALGSWAFRSLEVRVDPRVLIPRPETEQVAGYALEALSEVWAAGADTSARPADPAGTRARPAGPGERVVAVDLGTGSGAIALSLAAESRPPGRTQLEVWATDLSDDALDVARTNLALLERADPVAAARVRLARGEWFDALPATLSGRVQLIVSNPPYVSMQEWEGLAPEVRDHEPRSALVAGETGLEVLVRLVRGGARWLVPGGRLVLELAPAQAAPVAAEARRAGLVDVEVRPDLAGSARALVARLPDVKTQAATTSGAGPAHRTRTEGAARG